jgi:hypothetical protein
MSTVRQLGRPVQTFLIERYWPGVTVEMFTDAVHRLNESVAGLRREGIAIEAVTATLVPIDEAAYWIVDAPSADVVELACVRAKLQVERIVTALDLGRRRGPPPVDPGPSARSPRGDPLEHEASPDAAPSHGGSRPAYEGA